MRSLVQALTSDTGSPPDDAAQVSLDEIRNGEPRAEQVIAVWRLLRRLGVPDADADDATQQVFLVVAEHGKKIESGKERAYVYGTALRVAWGVLRKKPPRSIDVDEHELMAEEAAPIEELVDRHSARLVLDRLLEQMPFELRAVFVLFEIEELSLTEIAQTLEIPRGTAASRLRRAREDFEARVARLRARLARQGAKR